MNFGASKLTNDTIVAIASTGAISIVKLSGSLSLEIAQQICKKINFKPRYAHLTFLYDELSNPIDKAIVVYFNNPNSFTGEDVVEFQCHGGEVLANTIVELCLFYGAKIARAGEFSYRAVLNKKLTLSEAEAAAHLATTQSKKSIEALAKNLTGELNIFVENIRKSLLEILAYSETSIDYGTEDLPDTLIEELKLKLANVRQVVYETLHASKARQGLFDGFKIALIGKPNVGKSSLLNSLLSYERALVSDIAGTTRDTIEEWLNIGTYKAKLVDTAGIRQTEDKIENFGIELSLKACEQANIIVALFDLSNSLESEDLAILDLLNKHKDKNIVIALTKSDLPQILDTQLLSKYETVFVSKFKQNIDLIDNLNKQLKTLDLYEGTTLVGHRQISSLELALNSIDKASIVTDELELFSYNITEAIDELSNIVNPPVYDELLDTIFGTFCLGK